MNDLKHTDFPGADEVAFEQWKSLQSSCMRLGLINVAILLLVPLFSINVIGGAMGYFLPVALYFIFFLAAVLPVIIRRNKLQKQLGINRKTITEALLRKKAERTNVPVQ